MMITDQGLLTVCRWGREKGVCLGERCNLATAQVTVNLGS